MIEAYPQYEEWLARIQLVCFMLGMGVTLAVADFLKVAQEPRSLLLGLVGQVCVIPLVALGISHVLDLDGPIALGLIMVSAMPGGSVSKVFAYLGRGNAPLSITLTAVSTLATVVTVPITLRLLATEYVPADFEMPVGTIVADVVLFLLAPLAIGMIIGRVWPARQRTIARWAVRLGFVPLLLIVIGSIAAGRIRPAEHGFLVPLAIVLFCVAGQQLNMAPFYLLRRPRADRMAVGIEATMRNMNLALLLKSSLFGAEGELADGVLFVVLFYGAVAFFVGVPLALNHRRLARREETRPRSPIGPIRPMGHAAEQDSARDAP